MKYLIITVVLLVFVFIAYLSTVIISPFDKTITVMSEIKNRIIIYVNIYNEIPSDLNKLPQIQGHDNSVIDGWKHPIIYHCDKQNGIVTLISLVKNSEINCNKNNTCIIKKYKIKFKDGKWTDVLID